VRTIFDNLSTDWSQFAIPAAVFVVSIIALFWLRRWALNYLLRWFEKIQWSKDNFLLRSIRGPSSLLCLILSIYLGLVVSAIPANWKGPASNALWTLFILALTLSLLSLARSISSHYAKKFAVPNQVVLVSRNILRIIIVVVAVLVVMDLWGVPTSPLLLLIAVLIVIAILAFRDSIPDLFASFQIAATQEYRVGDYIKLDGSEEGYITNISWNRTSLKGLDGNVILVPNAILIHRKVVNYGRPLKKANRSFNFNTRTHLSELTGLKARNLKELVAVLKTAPENVIYYHTHHFLEEHQYLVPELTNDFANWVKNSLDDQVLGERLANVSIIEFNSLDNFRDKIVNIIETYLGQDHNQREVLEGHEFHFIKSVDVILPTSYSAHDLREFVESLRIITPNSLYFHVFESRLRLKNGINDFVVWLEVDLSEPVLSAVLSKIDPYSYTLEGLRSLLIQTIEKYIK
jgi:small-conductance mechanosensitive channel